MHVGKEHKKTSMTRHVSDPLRSVQAFKYSEKQLSLGDELEITLRNPDKPLTVEALYQREFVGSILLAQVVCCC